MNNPNVNFNADGLIPAIAQHYETGAALMLAYMNREALDKTIEMGEAHYYSRSRQCLWHKGETSGNTQRVREIRVDCDGDALLLLVDPAGPACHTGADTCFFTTLHGEPQPPPGDAFAALHAAIRDRRQKPKEGSYTNYLFDKGLDKILKKVGEESAETIIAAKNGDKTELTYEVADLIYHLSVTLAHADLNWGDIARELAKRRKS